MNHKNSENIENDTRLSKFNYRLRKYYLIETILLEKRLIYDLSTWNNYPIIYNVTDLEACYDRQLLIISGLMQELVGVNRKVIKAISNIIAKFNHFICTYFGIYKEKYEGDNDQLAGNRQRNIFAGVSYRD